MRRRALAAPAARAPFALAGLAAALAACTPQPAPSSDAGVSAIAPSAPAQSAPSASVAAVASQEPAPRPRPKPLPCRAIALDGSVTVAPVAALDAGAGAPSPAALALHGEVPDGAWLSLAKGARLVAKDPRTTRETTFIGPARVRACAFDREESWVAAGRFESTIGAGETPGAEEWVVTPFGVVRYMAAQAAVEARPHELHETRVQVANGAVFLWTPDDVRVAPVKSHDGGGPPVSDDDGWQRMGEGEVTLTAGAGANQGERARAAVDQCDALTRRAQSLAAALFAGPTSQTAKDQLRTKRLAEAACAVAALRVYDLPPSAVKGEMSARLEGDSAPAPQAPQGADVANRRP